MGCTRAHWGLGNDPVARPEAPAISEESQMEVGTEPGPVSSCSGLAETQQARQS